MAYTWTDGELITADKLNNTGGGGGFVVIGTPTETQGELSIDKSYSEIIAALEAGQNPLLLIYMNDTIYQVLAFGGMRYVPAQGIGMINFNAVTVDTASVVQQAVLIRSDSPNVGQLSNVICGGTA